MEASCRVAQAIDLVLSELISLFQSQIDKLFIHTDQCIGGVVVYSHAVEDDEVGKLFKELTILAHLVHPEEVTQAFVKLAAQEVVDSQRQATTKVTFIDFDPVETTS